jgi:uncharacterized protein (TIGR02996 family)
MRTFVLKSGTTSRFWNIQLGSYPSILVCTGQDGPGKITDHVFDSQAEARKEHDRLIAEKLAKGFVETTNEPWHGGFVSPLRTSLEETLAEGPDDLATHKAYADHLNELGDPRGEFIQVQLALEDESLATARRKELAKRESALLKQHQRTWLGPMASYWIDKIDGPSNEGYTSEAPHKLTWRRGWIDSLWLEDGGTEACEAAVARAPLLRLLRDFRILYVHDGWTYGPSLLPKAKCFNNVRYFQIGEDASQCFFRGQIGPDDFLKRMPRLEEFHCFDGSDARWILANLTYLKFPPGLARLSVHHGRGVYPLETLLKKKNLANLTYLSCWPKSQVNERPDEPNEDGGYAYISRRSAAALFRSKKLPKLQHLRLRNSDVGDEGVRILIASGLLKRLKTLDLMGGCVTDAGAQLLAECPDLLHLEALNLTGNLIGPTGLAALRRTKVNLTADGQLRPDALDSGEYLYTGDCE